MYDLGRGVWTPPVDVYLGEDRTVVVMELPGVTPEETHLEVTPGHLTVSGSRRSIPFEALSPLGLEIPSGPFERVVQLPSRVDTSSVEAVLENGLLVVTLRHMPLATVSIPVRDAGKPS